jgi:hypothetical protein
MILVRMSKFLSCFFQPKILLTDLLVFFYMIKTIERNTGTTDKF